MRILMTYNLFTGTYLSLKTKHSRMKSSFWMEKGLIFVKLNKKWRHLVLSINTNYS